MKQFLVSHFKYYQLSDISFELKTKQIMGLSGTSGSGKTLLLRALADLDENEGLVQLDDLQKNKTLAPQWRKKVSLLSAESQWWFDTVGEHFNVKDDALLKMACEKLGFSDDVMSWVVSRLSSGEKQRLALLRSLQNQPEVLLLDEPTANLDANNTDLFELAVKDYLQKKSAAAIWVSHDDTQLERVCDYRYQIKNGRLELC